MNTTLSIKDAEIMISGGYILIGYPHSIPVVYFNQLCDGIVNGTDSVRNLITDFLHNISPSLDVSRVNVNRYNQQELARLVNGIKSEPDLHRRDKLTFELIMFIVKPFDKIIIRDIRKNRATWNKKYIIRRSDSVETYSSEPLDLDAGAVKKTFQFVTSKTSKGSINIPDVSAKCTSGYSPVSSPSVSEEYSDDTYDACDEYEALAF